jgi:PilZ domain-containing protein
MGSGDQGIRRFERRWAPRFRYHADLEIEWGSTVLRARTRDLSSNGMFIESVDPLWVGAGFTAQLTLDKPLRVNCFVKRVEPGRGMGVSIALAEEHHHQRYQEFINSLSGTPQENQP